MTEAFNKLNELGYVGENNLSLIIDWIRIKYDFNIYVEHGTLTKKGKTFDLTTDFGCHRGNYTSYTKTQEAGILKFLSYLEGGHIKEIIKVVEEQPIVDDPTKKVSNLATSFWVIIIPLLTLYLYYFMNIDIFLIFILVAFILFKHK